MSAETPRVEGMCLAKSTWVNRAIGEYACAATQQEPEQSERTVRCPVKVAVLGTIDLHATQRTNRSAGYAEDHPRYTELHDTTITRDPALLEQDGFSDNCLAIDDRFPDIQIRP